MPYITGKDRYQLSIKSIDDMIDNESEARVIDAFVNSLDMVKMGFLKSVAAIEGRPGYNPKALLKLYLYGSRNGIRSSRKLMRACKVNIEVIWLMDELCPDHRVISDFRKDNSKALKAVFLEFNKKISGLVSHGYKSIDGSKIQANNSKDNNFTASKLDDRLANIQMQIDEYMEQMDAMDKAEDENEAEEKLLNEDPNKLSKDELQKKIDEITERKTRYEGYLKQLEETGASQISLVDPDSKLMKNKNGFAVSLNVQTAVDSETHMIDNFVMTNQATDHGMLKETVEEERNDQSNDGKIIEVTADKGYQDPKDMMNCLENGIIPHVILEGKDSIELETEYEEKECSAEDLAATTVDELNKCLGAGKIPEAYKDCIESIEVKEVRRKVTGEKEKPIYLETDPKNMKARAAEGFFVRDIDRNLVYCPAGEILRQKSCKKNGTTVYANKLACKNCPYKDRCITAAKTAITKWQEVSLKDKVVEKPCRKWNKAEETDISEEESKQDVAGIEKKVDETAAAKETGESDTESKTDEMSKAADAVEKAGTDETAETSENGEAKEKSRDKSSGFVKKKVVRIKFKPDKSKTTNRKCLSEHPFGTLKRTLGGGYFLLRGLTKTEGEFALLSLAYNLRRATNLLGFEKLMSAMV